MRQQPPYPVNSEAATAGFDAGSGRFAAASRIFQRKTSSGWFLPQIDGLRFVAIATVFIVHVIAYTLAKLPGHGPSWLEGHYIRLARGVELFFVISGFVIAMPFVKCALNNIATMSLKDFYVRRLTRLEPPFLVAMLLTFASLVLVHHSSARALLPHLWATCTYTHAMIYGGKSPIAFITWSLEIEVQFYVLAPLIFTALHLRPPLRRCTLIALAGAAGVLRALLASAHPVLSVSLIGYLPFFVAGILVCDLGISSDFWRKQRGLRWDGIGCLSLLVGYSIPNSLLVESAVLPLLFGFSIMAVFRGRLLAKIMAGPVVTAIGGMCYTIYLLHVPLIYFFGRLTRYAFVGHDVATNAVLQVLLLTVPILGMCCIFFLAIEKPCMNRHWPKELSQRVWWRGSNNMEAGHANV